MLVCLLECTIACLLDRFFLFVCVLVRWLGCSVSLLCVCLCLCVCLRLIVWFFSLGWLRCVVLFCFVRCCYSLLVDLFACLCLIVSSLACVLLFVKFGCLVVCVVGRFCAIVFVC